MSESKPIPIRFSKDERLRLQQAAAIAGYKYLSTYIHDKALGLDQTHGDPEAWAARQEINGRLAELGRGQQSLQATLALLIYLVKQKATTGDVSDLIAALEHAVQRRILPSNLLAEIEPALAEPLQRMTNG